THLLRLMGGASRCAGTLQVNQGEWRPVEDYGWTLKEAAVVCRELDCGSAVSRRRRKGSSKRPVWRINTESIIWSCLLDCRSSDSATTTCSPGKAVGLTCSEPFRLVGGASRCAGTLQVKLGEWRPLDCGSAVSRRRRKGSSKRLIWRINTGCVRSGFTLRDSSSSDSSFYAMEIICSGKPISDTICDSNATRGQKPVPQETKELDCYNVGVSRAEGGPAEEEGVQAAE
uniref:SRCR domain-containing protein n=1 Tax=Seriola lalandi dorsalis TaxID=1841481 RepID=A0A3B4XI55_SERLL